MEKQKKVKKKKPLAEQYDANGQWVEMRGQVKGAIRRVFRLSPQMKETLNAARVELPPLPRKDGSPGARVRVRFVCAICSGLFPRDWVQVDHIEPVVPLHRKESELSYDEMAYRIICSKENLQVVCSTPKKFLPKNEKSCHSIKTAKENWVRDYLNLKSPELRQGLVDEAKSKYDIYEKDQIRIKKEKEDLKIQRKLAQELKKSSKMKKKQETTD